MVKVRAEWARIFRCSIPKYMLEVFSKFVKIVFTDVVTCEEDYGILAIVSEPLKAVAECFDNGTRTEVATADTSHHDSVAVFAQHLSCLLDVSEVFRSD